MYVVDPRRKLPPRGNTFVDPNMHRLIRKKLEELYMKVVNAGELPLLKELTKHVGQLYYALEVPLGILKLVAVHIERIIGFGLPRNRRKCASSETYRPEFHSAK